MQKQTEKLSEPLTAAAQLSLPIGVKLGATSLEVPQTLGDEEVIELGRSLRQISNASAWWVADYIVFAQELFLGNKRPRREFFDRVAKLWPNYSRGTLQTYASIARRVPAKLRSPILSFDHHAHVATLFEEKNAPVMQAHYIKMAEQTEATAEELRLMIADTKNGIAMAKPKASTRQSAKAITLEVDEAQAHQRGSMTHDQLTARNGDPADDGLPIPRPAEPELMTGSHAQLASDAQRALARLLDWYTSRGRKEKPANWSDERKHALVNDLQPVLKQMHEIAEVVATLTYSEGVQSDA